MSDPGLSGILKVISLLANNSMEYDEEQITKMLDDPGSGDLLHLSWKPKNRSWEG